MRNTWDMIAGVLGLNVPAQSLTFVQISLRGVIVFVAALIMVRLGDRRFLSNKTVFDAILGFMLASVLARAVNGTAAFFPTLGGAAVLIALHKLFAFGARRSLWFGELVKGHPDKVVSNGVINRKAMGHHDVSEHDLCEDLRLNGNVEDPHKVKSAYIERNGQISVVK